MTTPDTVDPVKLQAGDFVIRSEKLVGLVTQMVAPWSTLHPDAWTLKSQALVNADKEVPTASANYSAWLKLKFPDLGKMTLTFTWTDTDYQEARTFLHNAASTGKDAKKAVEMPRPPRAATTA